MSTQMITVPGRILNPPTIKFQGKVYPREGSWNSAGQKFNRGSIIRGGFSGFQIQFIDKAPKTGNFGECFNTLCQNLNTYGIKIERKLAPLRIVTIGVSNPVNWNKIDDILESQFEDAVKKGIRWLWISIPSCSGYLYATLKKLGDIKYGIHTVVIRDENTQKVVQRGQDGTTSNNHQLIANEALKFSAKSGGLPWTIDPADLKIIGSGTMVIGIDVTHPSPGSQEKAPSIAAIVGSYDTQLSGWAADLRVQTSREEMVEGLTSMMKGRLEHFRKKNNGCLPSNIIVYRDGVSEGQFKLVLNIEYPAMVLAFDKLYGNRNAHPKVTIIVSLLYRSTASPPLIL
jgi:eukaryotic translation initiation factor 2C